jgi:hypothetical protein
LLFLVVPAAALAAWIFKPAKPDDLFAIPDDVASLRFDAQRWRDAGSNQGIRLQMVEDLLSTGALDGLTRKQVQDLLGLGDVQAASNVEAYSLQHIPVGEFGIGALVIYFDAGEHVQGFALKTFVYKL